MTDVLRPFAYESLTWTQLCVLRVLVEKGGQATEWALKCEIRERSGHTASPNSMTFTALTKREFVKPRQYAADPVVITEKGRERSRWNVSGTTVIARMSDHCSDVANGRDERGSTLAMREDADA